MATYQAEFLHQHYKGRIRPRSHYSLGRLPLTSTLAGYAARPINLLPRGPLGTLLARLGGVTTKRKIPAFASRRSLRTTLRAAKPGGPAKAILFVDSFTRAFRPGIAGATSRVLADAGIPCTPQDDLCCGPVGNFDFEAQRYDTSLAVADQAQPVREDPRTSLPPRGVTSRLPALGWLCRSSRKFF
ncbi:hypothetical protein [Streptomyces sp. NPDC092370]|uniref:hypothetical protein n=1 Tax=Streptomyces sp. NPDC092370 TaxID=3366016 RepID=UPI0038257BE4